MIKIPVKIPGLESRRRSIGVLHLLAGLFMISNAHKAFKLFALNSFLPLVPLICVAAASILYGAFRKRWDPTSKYNFGLRLLQAFIFLGYAIAFAQSGNRGQSIGLFLWVGISGMLAYSEKIALQEQNVTFTEKGFAFPAGYRQKQISWNTVADITFRPDFMTIHYRDNRFLQFEIKQPFTDADITHLQDFCRGQIANNTAAEQA